jgi:hypothetical protein
MYTRTRTSPLRGAAAGLLRPPSPRNTATGSDGHRGEALRLEPVLDAGQVPIKLISLQKLARPDARRRAQLRQLGIAAALRRGRPERRAGELALGLRALALRQQLRQLGEREGALGGGGADDAAQQLGGLWDVQAVRGEGRCACACVCACVCVCARFGLG